MSDDLLATRRFKALADEWTSEELGRFFWLTRACSESITHFH
jgi:hypothetical protein